MSRLTVREIRKQQLAGSTCSCDSCGKMRVELGVQPLPEQPAPATPNPNLTDEEGAK